MERKTTTLANLKNDVKQFAEAGYKLMQRGSLLSAGNHTVIPTGEILLIPFESEKVEGGKGLMIMVKATKDGKNADFSVNSELEAEAINAGVFWVNPLYVWNGNEADRALAIQQVFKNKFENLKVHIEG